MTTDRDTEAVKDESKTSTPPKQQIPTWRKRLYYAIGFFAIVLFYCFLVLAEAMNMSGDYSDFEPIPIRIEKEITYLQEPLREEGIINYTAAVNRQASEGVTPENNVVVPLAEMLGPDLFVFSGFEAPSNLLAHAFYEELGIAFPAAEGEYFLSPEKYASIAEGQDQENYVQIYDEQFGECYGRSWTREEYPELAAWVDYNSRFSVKLHQALQREAVYCPLVSDGVNGTAEGPLMNAGHPLPARSRDVSRFLHLKSTLALGENDLDSAIQHALDAHYLARHLSHSYGLIDSVVAIANDATAYDASLVLIQSEKLSTVQLTAFREHIHQLAPLPVMAEKVNQFERMAILDIFSRAAVSEPQGVEFLTNTKPIQQQGDTFVDFLRILDWNLILNMVNERFDLLYESMTLPTYAQRANAKIQLEQLSEKNIKQVTGWNLISSVIRLKINDRETVSKTYGNMYIELLVPGLMKARDVEDRARTRMKLLEIAFALEIHRQQQGQFPDNLDSILPAMRSEQLQDIFTGEPYLYTSEGEGYLLYSVGPNLKDDGAQDHNAIPRKDDIVVRQGENQPAEIEPDSAIE